MFKQPSIQSKTEKKENKANQSSDETTSKTWVLKNTNANAKRNAL